MSRRDEKLASLHRLIDQWMQPTGERRSGQTTRQIDAEIQRLFENGWVLVQDHHKNEGAQWEHERILFERLSNEHKLLQGKDLEWHPDTKILKFKTSQDGK